MLSLRVAGLLLAAFLFGGLSQTNDPPLGLDVYMPVPEDNPLTREKIALGRTLFFDPLLSSDQTLSCASCHNPALAFTDGRPHSIGVDGRRGPRSVPTLVNRVYGASQFWDGRSARLEDQALHPIRSPTELGSTDAELLDRLMRHPIYPARFREVFGREPNVGDVARALASYERTILSADAPIDRYVAGARDVLGPDAVEGLRVFREKANCAACHLGPNFTDERFHNTGVAWQADAKIFSDEGRFVVTGRPADRGAFKTPTLREVARTPPYMHDGSLATLEDVIEFYDRGGRSNPQIDREIRPLHLTPAQKRALAAFLKTLTGRLREG